jgi:competence protein ComEC
VRNPIRLRLLFGIPVLVMGLTSCSAAGEVGARTESSAPLRTVATTDPPATTPPDPAVPTPAPSPATTSDLTVRFLDVGQGDATLLTTGDTTILVDVGRHDRSDVVDALRHHGVDDIDLVAVTHPHADHIGQLDQVIAAVGVGEVWMSGTTATTATYARAMDAVERGGVGYEEPRTGDMATFGSLGVEVLHPSGSTGDAHDDMLALRITHGSNSFLFTGDAEGPVESALTSTGNVGATVYQVGHHGSATSTTAAFLADVNPQVAIYSAGAGNSYGHPHPDVLGRLRAAGVEVYGTDTHGTVTVTSDGTIIAVATSGGSASASRPAAVAVPTGQAPAATAPAASGAPVASSAGCAAGQVDINRAPASELVRIIHIGPERADAIVSARPFAGVGDLDRLDGIGPARLADILTEGSACV